MNKYVQIAFSIVFLFMVVFPWQVLAVSITETKAAIGEGCKATGDHSTAMGFYSTASSTASTAMGF